MHKGLGILYEELVNIFNISLKLDTENSQIVSFGSH